MLNKEVVDSVLSEVPSEVFDAISPLSNKNSQVIFIALIKKRQMRFGEIKEFFHVKNSEDINSPLKSLVKAGLVSKKVENLEDIGENEVALYCPTFMGESVMRSLYTGVLKGIDNFSWGPQKGSYAHTSPYSAGIIGQNKPVKFSLDRSNSQPISSTIGGR